MMKEPEEKPGKSEPIKATLIGVIKETDRLRLK